MTSAGSAGKGRRWFPPWLRTLLGFVVTGAALYFLATRLARDWSNVPWSEIHFNVWLLLLAFGILLFVYFPVFGLTWRTLLGTMGVRIRLLDAIAILTVSQMGKYIPGKLWFTLGRIYLAKRQGVPEAKTAVSAVMEAGFALLSALLLFAVALLLVPPDRLPGQVYLGFLFIPLCLVMIYPPVLNRTIRFILRRMKRPAFEINLSFPRILAILGLYVTMWLAQGLGFYFLINSFYPVGLTRLPIVVGGYAAAWILGFLSLITPAGLGVREGILTFALRFAMPESVAIVAALVARVWITLAEAGVALVMAFFLKRKTPEAS